MFYVFGDIGFLGTVAQFRVGHTSERSREPLPDYVDPLGLSPFKISHNSFRLNRFKPEPLKAYELQACVSPGLLDSQVSHHIA